MTVYQNLFDYNLLVSQKDVRVSEVFIQLLKKNFFVKIEKKNFFFWNKKFFFETKNYLITDIYKVKKNTFPEKNFFFNFENPGYGNSFVTKIAGYGNAIWWYIKNLFDYNLLVSQKDVCPKFLFKF